MSQIDNQYLVLSHSGPGCFAQIAQGKVTTEALGKVLPAEVDKAGAMYLLVSRCSLVAGISGCLVALGAGFLVNNKWHWLQLGLILPIAAERIARLRQSSVETRLQSERRKVDACHDTARVWLSDQRLDVTRSITGDYLMANAAAWAKDDRSLFPNSDGSLKPIGNELLEYLFSEEMGKHKELSAQVAAVVEKSALGPTSALTEEAKRWGVFYFQTNINGGPLQSVESFDQVESGTAVRVDATGVVAYCKVDKKWVTTI